jgi:betaine reductase
VKRISAGGQGDPYGIKRQEVPPATLPLFLEGARSKLNMQLKGKKVIIIGERDGIQGPAIEACLRSAGAEPVLVQTQCFV